MKHFSTDNTLFFHKVSFCLFIIIAFNVVCCQDNSFAVDKWRAGTGANTILGTSNISDIDTNSYSSIVAPLDRVLSNYREGVRLKYNSVSSVTIEAGEVVCSNSAGTIRMLSKNTSSISTTWSVTTNGLDTGSEASGTTYYIFAIATVGADTFTVFISASSTAPTGATYYKRLGSFYNNASGNIDNKETFVNDNNYYGKTLGAWVSKSVGTIYQATTDGFVVAGYSACGQTATQMYGYTDSSSSPSTVRGTANATSWPSVEVKKFDSLCIPVKKGDYYKTTSGAISGYSDSSTSFMYWVPSQ